MYLVKSKFVSFFILFVFVFSPYCIFPSQFYAEAQGNGITFSSSKMNGGTQNVAGCPELIVQSIGVQPVNLPGTSNKTIALRLTASQHLINEYYANTGNHLLDGAFYYLFVGANNPQSQDQQFIRDLYMNATAANGIEVPLGQLGCLYDLVEASDETSVLTSNQGKQEISHLLAKVQVALSNLPPTDAPSWESALSFAYNAMNQGGGLASLNGAKNFLNKIYDLLIPSAYAQPSGDIVDAIAGGAKDGWEFGQEIGSVIGASIPDITIGGVTIDPEGGIVGAGVGLVGGAVGGTLYGLGWIIRGGWRKPKPVRQPVPPVMEVYQPSCYSCHCPNCNQTHD